MVFLSVVQDFQISIRYPSCAQKGQQFVFRLWVAILGHHAGGYNIWRNPNSSTPRIQTPARRGLERGLDRAAAALLVCMGFGLALPKM
jgi:hypothetical protein